MRTIKRKYQSPNFAELKLLKKPAPQPIEAFHEALANRKWLSQQRRMPRYNWEGMKARQNAEMERDAVDAQGQGAGNLCKTVQTIAKVNNAADIAISAAEQTIQNTRVVANLMLKLSYKIIQ